MAVPKFHDFFSSVLKLSASGTVRMKQAAQTIADEFDLSEEERQEMLPSGRRTRVLDRTSWAVTYLFHAGLLKRPQKGYFTITEEGKKALSEKPENIDLKYLEQFPKFQEFQKRKRPKPSNQSETSEEHVDSETPEERIDSAHEDIRKSLEGEVLERILNESPEFFERLVIKLLHAMGYGDFSGGAGKHVGGSGDGGIDGVISQDKLGMDNIYIQAKRYDPDNAVDRPEIQKFSGSLDGQSVGKGVFFTTSSFTRGAQEYAEGIQKSLILIDGDQLVSLMIENNVGIRLDRSIELKRIDEDFFLGE